MTSKPQQSNKPQNPISISGAGPAGMITALCLAQKGIASQLIGPLTSGNDLRTTALMMPAIEVLKNINVWDELSNHAAALSTMRIIDGTNRLIRSPTVSFRASEINEKAFGYNMPNESLNAALEKHVKANALITRIHATVSHIHHQENNIEIKLVDDRIIKSKLLIAADGRHSMARKAASIDIRTWQYPQTAVILSFSHTLPHQNISTEFHTEEGPFTQVPLPNSYQSSLVWVCNPQHAAQLLALGPNALAQAIETQMHSMLGTIKVNTTPQAWPLSGIVPKQFGARRTLLVGEAAHVFPPIGAQGLNLGVRDAINIVESVMRDPTDPGSDTVIQHYNRIRRPDIWVRTGSVDALNRTLLSDFLPAQLVRSLGLEVLRQLPPLRNFFMREGMTPGNGLRNIIAALPLGKLKLKT